MGDSTSTIEGIDKTPEIFYENSLARLVIEYYIVCSGRYTRERVEFGITAKGRYNIWQQGLENVYPRHQRKLRRKYLEDMAENNPGALPVIDVLGHTEEANRKLLEELGITARHLGIEDYVKP